MCSTKEFLQTASMLGFLCLPELNTCYPPMPQYWYHTQCSMNLSRRNSFKFFYCAEWIEQSWLIHCCLKRPFWRGQSQSLWECRRWEWWKYWRQWWSWRCNCGRWIRRPLFFPWWCHWHWVEWWHCSEWWRFKHWDRFWPVPQSDTDSQNKMRWICWRSGKYHHCHCWWMQIWDGLPWLAMQLRNCR